MAYGPPADPRDNPERPAICSAALSSTTTAACQRYSACSRAGNASTEQLLTSSISELARSSRYFHFVAVAIFSKWVPVQRKRWFTLKLSRTWNVRTLHSQT